jgi:gamma-glutamylcyclotransferase (GGCT)/AIG2-like uncharacterized protein YtfP
MIDTFVARAGETLVFVYGSLLTGECHHGLMDRARPLGVARTAASYDLVDLGDFPALVEGGHTRVTGEVYAVDRVTLLGLDEHEDHPDTYVRRMLDLEDGTRVESYLLAPSRANGFPRIEGGSWRSRHLP